jgi:hypothetical protein
VPGRQHRRFSQIINDLIGKIGSTAQLSWSADTMAQRRLDGLRLLRQAIPVTEIAFVDASGIVKLRASRVAPDTVDDLSHHPKFTQAVAHKVYYGPAYLRHDMIYITLSVAGSQRENGVSVAELNLSLEEFVRRLKVGEHGVGYILDAQGRVIVHSDMFVPAPDASGNRFTLDPKLFQRDLSGLAQVQAAVAAGSGPTQARAGHDISGREVLSASAIVAGPGWRVFVELPLAEADAAVP